MIMTLNVKATALIKKFLCKYVLDILLFSLILFLLCSIREWERDKKEIRYLSPKSARN